jgi:hypothetical protein
VVATKARLMKSLRFLLMIICLLLWCGCPGHATATVKVSLPGAMSASLDGTSEAVVMETLRPALRSGLLPRHTQTVVPPNRHRAASALARRHTPPRDGSVLKKPPPPPSDSASQPQSVGAGPPVNGPREYSTPQLRCVALAGAVFVPGFPAVDRAEGTATLVRGLVWSGRRTARARAIRQGRQAQRTAVSHELSGASRSRGARGATRSMITRSTRRTSSHRSRDTDNVLLQIGVGRPYRQPGDVRAIFTADGSCGVCRAHTRQIEIGGAADVFTD